MALPSSATSLSNIRMKSLKSQSCQLHSHLLINVRRRPISVTSSFKLPTTAQFRDPSNIKLHMNYVRKKLWDAIPNPIKDFPWKKAEAIASKQFLLTGKEALKWSLVALLIVGSISDIIFSISTNKELLVPFGLFVGCIMAMFLKETSQELFPNLEERGLSWNLLGVCCFFVLVKILATYFTLGRRVFLLHVANGGLLQILWPWRNSQEENDRDDGKQPLAG